MEVNKLDKMNAFKNENKCKRIACRLQSGTRWK